jgi:biotin carboxyl carrier protein
MADLEDRYIVTVDDVEYDIRLAHRGSDFAIEYNGASHRVAVDKLTEKKFLLKIDNGSTEVDISRDGDGLDIFLEGKEMQVKVEPYNLAELRRRTGAALTGTEDKIIRAPMPGLVLSVAVKAGDTVKRGMTLAIIEAMKMENMIKSSTDGVVTEIFVSAGRAVDKNEKLLELE